MIHFNNPEFDNQRHNVNPLTLEEEQKAADILNRCFNILEEDHGFDMTKEYDLLQKFVWNYENLKERHDMSQKINGDLWEYKEK